MMQSQVRPHHCLVAGLPLHPRPDCAPCAEAIEASVERVSAFLRGAGWVCANGVVESTRRIDSEWLAVHPVRPEDWPAPADLCVEVWYFLPVELRAAEVPWPASEPLEAAERRIERMEILAQQLRAGGANVSYVDRGWLGPNLLVLVGSPV